MDATFRNSAWPLANVQWPVANGHWPIKKPISQVPTYYCPSAKTFDSVQGFPEFSGEQRRKMEENVFRIYDTNQVLTRHFFIPLLNGLQLLLDRFLQW